MCTLLFEKPGETWAFLFDFDCVYYYISHMKDKLIFCFYIGVGDDMSPETVSEVIESAKKSNGDIFTENGAMAFFIPVKGDNSRIECVNPVMLTEEEAKNNFSDAMDRLNKVLKALENKSEHEKTN